MHYLYVKSVILFLHFSTSDVRKAFDLHKYNTANNIN